MFCWLSASLARAFCRLSFCCLVGAAGLVACNPALNWREVRLKDSPLLAMLPCKGEASKRVVTLGGREANMKLLSCEASGALFVVGQADVLEGGPSGTGDALANWQRTALANIAAPLPGQTLQPSSLRIAGLPEPQILLETQGKRPGGAAVQFSGLWFSRGAQVFHAAIYAERLSPDMGEPFFGGLALQ